MQKLLDMVHSMLWGHNKYSEHSENKVSSNTWKLLLFYICTNVRTSAKVAAPVYKTEINDRRRSDALTARQPSIHKS
jgi:hypothetical protein